MKAHFMTRALAPTLLIGAMVMFLGAAATFFGAESGDAAVRPRFDMTRGVLLSSRPNLKVCVEPDPSDARGDAVAGVHGALARLNSDATFRAGGYAEPAWQLARNCPEPGRLLVSGQRHAKAGGTYALGPEATNPSPFTLFVYVVSTAEIQRMFGSLPFHFAGQEVFCQERQCATVTTALYVDKDTVSDQDRLVAELEMALGLRSPYPADPSAGNGPKEVK